MHGFSVVSFSYCKFYRVFRLG